MKFTETMGGAWVCGPYAVVERVDDKGWNCCAHFEDVPCYLTLNLQGSREDGWRAAKEFDAAVEAAAERLGWEEAAVIRQLVILRGTEDCTAKAEVIRTLESMGDAAGIGITVNPSVDGAARIVADYLRAKDPRTGGPGFPPRIGPLMNTPMGANIAADFVITILDQLYGGDDG